MAFVFQAAGFGANTNSAAIDTRNGGGSTAISDGNLVTLFVADDDSSAGAITWPSGFTNRATQAVSGPDGHAVHIATKQAGASEPDTYTVTSSGGFGNMAAVMIVDDDLDESTIDVGTFALETSGVTGAQTVTYNSITASAGDTVYAFIGTDDVGASDDHAFTPPSGYTERAETFSAGSWSSLAVSELDGASAGATGAITQSVTFAGNAGYAAVLLTFGTGGGTTFDLNAETGSITVSGVNADIGEEAAVDTIAATDLTANKIYQRLSGARDIVFSGTNSGETPDNVQVQLYESDGTTVAQAWTELTSATITSTTFTGTLSVPEGGMYRFAVRSRNSGNTVLATSTTTTNLWGVGDIGIKAMDSDGKRYFTSDSDSGLTPNALARIFDYTTETWQTFGSDGIAITIANNIIAQTGVPFGFVDASKSGGLAENYGTSGTTDYNKIDSITGKVGDAAYAMVNAGANDCFGGTLVLATVETWLAGLETLLRNNCGASLPIYYQTVSRYDPADGGTGSLDSNFTIARQAHDNRIKASALNRGIMSILDADMSAFHLTAAAYQNLVVPRATRVALFELGEESYFRGPQITALNVSGTTGTATVVNNGTSLTIDTNNGLSATDDNGALSISSVTSPDANALTITFGATPVGTVELSYGLGEAPHAAGEGINDNTAETLPLEPFFSLEATTATEIDASSGSFLLTGDDAALTIDYALNAEPSTISLSGVDTALSSDVSLNAEIGSLSIAGVDLTTTQDIDLNAETSSVDVTGIDATLGSLPVFNINAETGAVSITGVANNATIDYSINAEPSNVDVTGIDAALGSTTTFDLNAETGTVSISGVDSQLTRDLNLNAELGIIGITAPDATIGDNIVFNLNAETGSIAVSGVNNKGEYSLNFNAQPTSLAINGVDIQTGAGFSLNAETSLISVDGVDVVSTKDFVLNAATGQIDLTAIDALLSLNLAGHQQYRLSGTNQEYPLNGIRQTYPLEGQ